MNYRNFLSFPMQKHIEKDVKEGEVEVIRKND